MPWAPAPRSGRRPTWPALPAPSAACGRTLFKTGRVQVQVPFLIIFYMFLFWGGLWHKWLRSQTRRFFLAEGCFISSSATLEKKHCTKIEKHQCEVTNVKEVMRMMTPWVWHGFPASISEWVPGLSVTGLDWPPSFSGSPLFSLCFFPFFFFSDCLLLDWTRLNNQPRYLGAGTVC